MGPQLQCRIIITLITEIDFYIRFKFFFPQKKKNVFLDTLRVTDGINIGLIAIRLGNL